MSTNARAASDIELSTPVSDLLDDRPDALAVLEDFGIRLDPWTMIALKCTLQELAEYSALRRPEELRDALRSRLAAEAPASPGVASKT